MKKFLALLLALVMCLSLVACGGSDEPAEAETSTSEVAEEAEETEEEEVTDTVTITDKDGKEVSQETLAELTEAYNAVAVVYNDIATAANENGWMSDEQTATELNAVSTTLSFIGTALAEDITMLEGSDFGVLIDSLENEVPTIMDELSERVSVPYEE